MMIQYTNLYQVYEQDPQQFSSDAGEIHCWKNKYVKAA